MFEPHCEGRVKSQYIGVATEDVTTEYSVGIYLMMKEK